MDKELAMKTKILISAMALAFGSAAMAADVQSDSEAAAAKPDLELGSPDVQNQGQPGGPASAKPDLQLGSEDVRNQGEPGGPASAQPEMQLGQTADEADNVAIGNFSDLDTNHDGYISKEEANAQVKDRWETADTNADGKLDQSEFSALESTEPGDTVKHDNMGDRSDDLSESGRAMDKMEKPEN